MDLVPKHTKVVQALTTHIGTIVREDYFGYPEDKSNLYMIDENGNTVWFADLPMDGDAYSNQFVLEDPNSIRCCSWNGYDCKIDLRDGSIINSRFSK